MKLAYFLASPQLIAEALNMPLGCEITGAEWDFSRHAIRIFVTGADLPVHVPNTPVVQVTPIVTKKEITWDWGLDK